MSDAEFVVPFDNLPDGFAERVGAPNPAPATPRPAATIVLLRDGEAGMELLLMRRNRKAGFVPGAYVFPGGRVDGSDVSPEMLAHVDGLTPGRAESRLELADAEPPAIAYYLAALREAFEETGILVGRAEGGAAPPTAAEDADVDAIRDGLMRDEVSFAAALERMGCRIAGASIEYIAHWITPEAEPRRYDTRFFAAKVPPGAQAIVDPREMTDALWATPATILDRLDRGTLPMVFPTIKTVEQLGAFDSADAALDALADRPVRTILPTLVVTPTGVGLRVDD